MMSLPSDLVSAESCRDALAECMALGYSPGHLGGRCKVDARRLVGIVTGRCWIVQRRTSERILAACAVRLAEPDEEPVVVCTGLEVHVVRHPRGWGWTCLDCHRSRWHVVGPRGAARVAAARHRRAVA